MSTGPSIFEMPDTSQSIDFMRHVADLCVNHYAEASTDRSVPSVLQASPEKIHSMFSDAGISLEIAQDEKPHSAEELREAVNHMLTLTPKVCSPKFMNQLYGRPDPVSLAAEFVTAIQNGNSHTFECGPVATLAENACLARLAQRLGGKFMGLKTAGSINAAAAKANGTVIETPVGNGIEAPSAKTYDGLFVPGGSSSNLYAMHLARAYAAPDMRRTGLQGLGKTLVAFTSAQSHYSYLKTAIVLGIGTDNLIKVETDKTGAMRADMLEQHIQKALADGKQPFFVGATTGTTVLGAFDPCEAIADICEEYGLWMHCDGAWGGAFILSDTHRHRLKGAERADSFCFNPHKMLGVAMTCSVFITNHPDILTTTNASGATYLFQPDKKFTEQDIGDKTIQCGRKPDATKLWMCWKAYGDAGLSHRVNRAAALAKYAADFVVKDNKTLGRFQMVVDQSCANCCFWYIPPRMRPCDNVRNLSAEEKKDIGQVHAKIKSAMQKEGGALVGFQPLNDLPNFFRLVLSSAWTIQAQDLDTMFADMDRIGSTL